MCHQEQVKLKMLLTMQFHQLAKLFKMNISPIEVKKDN